MTLEHGKTWEGDAHAVARELPLLDIREEVYLLY
jgi:hypothetical protein